MRSNSWVLTLARATAENNTTRGPMHALAHWCAMCACVSRSLKSVSAKCWCFCCFSFVFLATRSKKTPKNFFGMWWINEYSHFIDTKQFQDDERRRRRRQAKAKRACLLRLWIESIVVYFARCKNSKKEAHDLCTYTSSGSCWLPLADESND